MVTASGCLTSIWCHCRSFRFDPCPSFSSQFFLLQVRSGNPDGSDSIIRSVPCSAGSDKEVCMVEVRYFCVPDENEAQAEHVMAGLNGIQFLDSVVLSISISFEYQMHAWPRIMSPKRVVHISRPLSLREPRLNLRGDRGRDHHVDERFYRQQIFTDIFKPRRPYIFTLRGIQLTKVFEGGHGIVFPSSDQDSSSSVRDIGMLTVS